MKRREFLKLSGTIAGAAVTAYLPAGWTPARAAAKWRVGFSQCTTLEPWRVQFNKDIEAEAKNYPEVDLIITDGQDQTQKQVADCENLIVQHVDVLLISPKESAGLTGVVEKAIDAKIPVIVLDRNVDTKRITEFIGGDNVLIGKTAGEYAVKLLGGPGKAAGNVVEIWGGMGTAPAHDRHDGFHAVTDKEPGIKYLLNNQSGDWKQDKAYNIMTTALRNNEKIDLVYGHNDPMAYGAYLAIKDAGRQGHQVHSRHRRPAGRGRGVGQQRVPHRDLPLCDAGRRGAARGRQAAQGRKDPAGRNAADHGRSTRTTPRRSSRRTVCSERTIGLDAGRSGRPRPAFSSEQSTGRPAADPSATTGELTPPLRAPSRPFGFAASSRLPGVARLDRDGRRKGRHGFAEVVLGRRRARLQRVLGGGGQGEAGQAEDGVEALHELDGARLHFLDCAGDELDDPDRALALLHVRQQVGQGLDREIRLELGDDRLLVDQRGALLRPERGERLVVAEHLGRALEPVAPHRAARLGHQDQHADHRLLEAAAIDAEQDRLDFGEEAQELRVLARALEGERLAEAQHQRRAVDPEEGRLIGRVAPVAEEVERVFDALRPQLLQEQERVVLVGRLALGERLRRLIGGRPS